jgi:outer membrane protein assembly factor BamD (BamD/ComL family)
MSIAGILSSNLFSSGAAQGNQHTEGVGGNGQKFQQLKSEFQQLGQDLQAGNLTKAQSDYATLSQNFPGASQTGAAAATTTAAAATTAAPTNGTTTAASTSTTGNSTVAQQFAQLGQDLQSGNLQAAVQDYSNLQQTAQQGGQQNGSQQVGGHHRHGHHHHGGETQSASSSTSSSQQSNPIAQAFSTLSQDLQAGNLSGAQSAFATLQTDLQQIGGFASPGSSTSTSPSSTSASASAGSLNVTA